MGGVAVDTCYNESTGGCMSLFRSLLVVQTKDGIDRLREARDVPALFVALSHADEEVRRAAAVALLQICDARSAGSPACAVMDGCGLLGEAVAEALQELGSPRTVDSLCDALIEGCSTVREAAARVLGEIGDPRALKALRGAAKDADSLVREAAAEAIEKLRRAGATQH